MSDSADEARVIAADIETLRQMGYRQELLRRMSGFSNYAVSLSIICILAGGITSFHQGLCSVGGASIGIGWPLACLLALAFAATMGQVASAFPTAGGLYHWASILGDRGWGWVTAWFNLAGLITVLAAVNVGAYQFTLQALAPWLGYEPEKFSEPVQIGLQTACVAAITLSQAMFNHLGIRLTTRLTDFSGYWIVLVAGALTIALLGFASHLDLGRLEFARLITFSNYSGLPAEPGTPVWPQTGNLLWLFALGFLLPLYTITGFDASAHTAEETVGAAHHVPRAIVRSVVVSAVFGWIMLAAMVLALPSMNEAAAQGDNAFHWMMRSVLPSWLVLLFVVGIAIAQYLCGLATVTSASRMTYAFARDGGLPWSQALRRVSPRYGSPAVAIWMTAFLALALTVYTPMYSTLASALRDPALRLVRAADAVGTVGLRALVDRHGALEPRPLVSAAGFSLPAGLWILALDRHPAAERESRVDCARRVLSDRHGLVQRDAAPLPGASREFVGDAPTCGRVEAG